MMPSLLGHSPLPLTHAYYAHGTYLTNFRPHFLLDMISYHRSCNRLFFTFILLSCQFTIFFSITQASVKLWQSWGVIIIFFYIFRPYISFSPLLRNMLHADHVQFLIRTIFSKIEFKYMITLEYIQHKQCMFFLRIIRFNVNKIFILIRKHQIVFKFCSIGWYVMIDV